ncbi:hypothetical protein [Corynebacterium minutissimum]|uniref:hypothetical protein n=1 Tax=Corynebacterium minutissimum TaxID=38301 RepID=UPI001EF2F4DB|nr:hypothetical protein [Corynebacterium minutissimum]MCG7230537.1 hypothetical protein [Corynebacterium minutissimum]MCG7239693.1 hypothetical protein [Corynebacterium minutissimum]
MESKTLTSLVFGNVVLESQMTKTIIVVYADDMRSWYFRPSPYTELKVPLDELRGQLSRERAELISERIFNDVKFELEESYPGGVDRAQRQLCGWLLREEPTA